MVQKISALVGTLATTPVDALAMLVSLGGLAVAGFSIYAIWSIARQKGRR